MRKRFETIFLRLTKSQLFLRSLFLEVEKFQFNETFLPMNALEFALQAHRLEFYENIQTVKIIR